MHNVALTLLRIATVVSLVLLASSRLASQAPTTNPSPDAKDATKDNLSPGRVVRLYHMREASAIATAINKMAGSSGDLVEALDNDQILILPQSADRMEEIHRTIALLDLPRPQVALEVWSYQISSKPSKQDDEHKRADEVNRAFDNFVRRVDHANDALETALGKGMRAVERDAQAGNYFDQDFQDYLTDHYEDCLSKDRYCLGYTTALQLPIQGNKEISTNASLNRFLLLLAAAGDDKIEATIGHMKEKMDPEGTIFRRFFGQLDIWSDKSNLHAARAAILEFLFQYKLATRYPRDSSPYGLQQAAHALDNIISPLVDAFGKDTDDYVECELQPGGPVCKTPRKEKEEKTTVSALFGRVGVSTISGTQAKVEGKVSNYFDITEPPNLSDALANVSSKGTTSGLGAALGGILTDKEIAAAQFITNVASQQKVYAQVGKDASLTITPTSLDDASAAELDLQFDVKDDNPPTAVDQGTTKTDRLDRVAEHSVTDHVRVESLRLFEVSAFTMRLTHQSQPQCWSFSPLCVAWKAVAGGIPGLGNLLEVTPPPQVTDNQSAAVVRAIVAPTAMDLGLSVRYEVDRIDDPGSRRARPVASLRQQDGRAFEFHRQFVQCVVQGPKKGAHNCFEATKLSEMREELPGK